MTAYLARLALGFTVGALAMVAAGAAITAAEHHAARRAAMRRHPAGKGRNFESSAYARRGR